MTGTVYGLLVMPLEGKALALSHFGNSKVDVEGIPAGLHILHARYIDLTCNFISTSETMPATMQTQRAFTSGARPSLARPVRATRAVCKAHKVHHSLSQRCLPQPAATPTALVAGSKQALLPSRSHTH